MTRTLLGGYFWETYYQGVCTFQQIVPSPDGNHEHQSFDIVAGSPIDTLRLIPLLPSHREIMIRIAAEWTIQKVWTRTFLVDELTGTQTEQPVIDTIRIRTPQTILHVHIYPDGSIAIGDIIEP